MEDASHVAQFFHTMDYEQPFEPVPGVQAHSGGGRAYPGLGGGGAGYRGKRPQAAPVVFGGYRAARPALLRDPVLPQRADAMIMECTYGDRPHDDPQMAFDELRQAVGRTLGRGGKVIIPAFAVGRTQELVYDLHQMMDKGEIPSVAGVCGQPAGGERLRHFPQAPGVLRPADAAISSPTTGIKLALGFDPG